MSEPVYLGVDVGTGSARAGVFDARGRMLGMGARELETWRPAEDHVEQSSDDVWTAVCAATRAAVSAADVDAGAVRGIGFDATCSLVALGSGDRPVSVSVTKKPEQNIVVWMDHRATAQAERINASPHEVLRYVGGVISPEMQVPKLLWLSEEHPDCWNGATRFFDLPDYLSYRATGEETRSLCTTVCKWTYDGARGSWDAEFFREVGLACLAEEDFVRIGNDIRPPGERVGGLTQRAAEELGLREGTPVAVSLIDAHAGGIGLLGTPEDGQAATAADIDFDRRLALIGGTSSCHMAVSKEPRFLPGIWGPYRSAMLPGYWLTEGGQSATGSLVDHVIHTHARAPELVHEATRRRETVYELLNERLREIAARQTGDEHEVSLLTRRFHVLPYYHGNRSPRANPRLTGMVCGFRLSDSLDSLALYYLATMQAIAHGTRHIIHEMNEGGYAIDLLIACGGGTKNEIFLQEHANATGCRILLPEGPEAVLLGSAMLGAVASGDFASLTEAMQSLSAPGRMIVPGNAETLRFHDAKQAIFQRMYDDQLAYDALIGD